MPQASLQSPLYSWDATSPGTTPQKHTSGRPDSLICVHRQSVSSLMISNRWVTSRPGGSAWSGDQTVRGVAGAFGFHSAM